MNELRTDQKEALEVLQVAQGVGGEESRGRRMAVAEEPDPGKSKFGLALSGGGFRAACFHLGVLARLAEQDVLPRIRVISTVSGGSIIGAAYYLRLRQLLSEQEDPEREDFINLVEGLESDMYELMRINVRNRIFADPRGILKMAWPFSSYSRTDRLGEVLDQHLYRRLAGRPPGDKSPMPLRDLIITPKSDTTRSFDLDEVNDRREEAAARVPSLVINASSLNTGHVWRFEAVRMGECPPPKDGPESVDSNRTIMPGYFHEEAVPEEFENPGSLLLKGPARDFSLSHAVAASAAVPGIFAPLTITGMHPDFSVKLVDGGLVDNQGVQSLRDHGCDLMLISDGSGQIDDQQRPARFWMKVLKRSSAALKDRIRDLQLERFSQAVFRDDGTRELLGVIHLREGLVSKRVDPGLGWGRPDLGEEGVPDPPRPGVEEVSRPVHRGILSALSDLRTDLDRFTEEEISSLACAGYFGLDPYFQTSSDREKGSWRFLDSAEEVQRGDPELIARLLAGRGGILNMLARLGK